MANLVFIPFILFFTIFFYFSEASTFPTTLFILGGQSNMAGRGGVFWNAKINHSQWDGFIPPESQPNASILRFTAESTWELAHEPLHLDIDPKKTNGVGPGMSFANELLIKARSKVGTIGLVPCAVGGTYLREWVKGTVNYTKLVNRINASEKFGGKLRAFFWYQGESDASVRVDAEFYEQNLAKFFTDLRADLHCPLPIILVKIANWDTLVSPVINYTEEIRRAEEAVKNKLPMISIVDSREAIRRAMSHNRSGLNPDGHMSLYSELEMGKMLSQAYLQDFA